MDVFPCLEHPVERWGVDGQDCRWIQDFEKGMQEQ